MNKFVVIIAVIIAAIAVVLIAAYVIKFPPAVELVTPLTETFDNLKAGNIDFQTIITGASMAGTATSAISLYGQYKDKLSAQASEAQQTLANNDLVAHISDLNIERDNITTQLNNEIASVTQQKDKAIKAKEEIEKKLTEQTDYIKSLEENVKFANNVFADAKKEVKEVIRIE